MRKTKFFRVLTAGLIAAAALLAAEPSSASEKGVPLESLYDEGFWFVGPDDKLRVGGWGQEDLRLPEAGHPGPATFVNRRARLYAAGYLEKNFGYLIMIALERAASPLQFAWVEYNQYPRLKLRAGQFKQPFGMEELTPDLYLDLMERSVGMSNLSPAQDMGAMLHGKLGGNRLEYAFGVFNGRGRNTEDNAGAKDLAGRAAFAPFSGRKGHPLEGLILGADAAVGRQEEDLSTRTFVTAAQTKFWTYAGGVAMSGERRRLGADLAWFSGPASVKGEWTRTAFDGLRKGALAEDAVFGSWYVSGTYLLTGEHGGRGKPVVPRRPFEPALGQWGAWELALRYEEFKGKQSLLDRGFAAGTNELWALTSGINWTPNPHIRLNLNHVYAGFDDAVTVGGKRLGKENAYLCRVQFEF